MASGRKTMSLGALLIEQGVIESAHLDEALAAQKSLGLPLGETLIRLGLATPSEVFPVLQSQMNVPWADLSLGVVDPEVVSLISREKADRYGVLSLFRVRENLTVAMHDPRAIFVIDELEHLTGLRVLPVLVSQTDVRRAISEYYTQAALEAVEGDADEMSPMSQREESFSTDLSRSDSSSDSGETSPVVQLVNLIISNAVKENASDVHIEPGRDTISVRFRIDGELHQVMTPKLSLHPSLISRLKVMTRMDIAEHRRPQDGRMRITTDGREIDVRASCMPTTCGEKMALRILDRQRLNFDLNELGMQPGTRSVLDDVLSHPHGMVLVTGPTGSGKTTTLYCLLDQLRGESRNIVSVEDPVEYDFEYVNQVQVNEAIGLNFAGALRTFLRQDPDYIMVGEIRDLDTARVAVQSALTGHLVLSTLHTNDAVSSIARLINIGVDPSMVAAGVTAVIAQRLLRSNCPKCTVPDHPSEETLRLWGIAPSAEHRFMRGAGCAHCFGTGLRGRLGVYAVFVMDDVLRAAISDGASTETLQEIARSGGLRGLYSEGVDLVTSGKTTMNELVSVVPPESLMTSGEEG